MSQEKVEQLMLYQKYIERGEYDKLPEEVLQRLAERVLVTTECCPQGLIITDRLGIVVAPAVIGMFVVRDWFARLRDIWGGRSRSSQNVITTAGNLALTQLRIQALKRGANAVIAIDLEYGEISGKGKSMHQVVANGTAVRCTKM